MKAIEIYERYISNPQEIQYLEELGIDSHRLIRYRYRSLMVFIDDIESVKGIRNTTEECVIKFVGGGKIVAKGNYLEISILINDLRNNNYEETEGTN